MQGHVFLIHGDLTKLHADGYAVSANYVSKPSGWWRDHVGEPHADAPVRLEDGREVRRWHWPDGRDNVWTVPVAGNARRDFPWYAQAIRAFARVAAGAIERKGGRPLIAIPNLGAGGGGQAARIGDHVPRLLDLLRELADEHDVDFAYVLRDREAYEAAQVHRMALGREAWPLLSSRQTASADELARRAVRGELALFLGAGVSMSAGLPGWGELLERVEKELSSDPASVDDLRHLDMLDRAQLLEREHGDKLFTHVAEHTGGRRRYAMAHAMLASLRVQEVVTTNYDVLYEAAASAQHNDVHVIPYGGPAPGRWLLKLHGCAQQKKEDIVLSRPSFTGFDGTRGALAGLLGGLLLTRHVLFVGTSLADANVLRIVDAVQRALGPSQRTLGTNLAVKAEDTAARARLWSGVLAWEAMEDPRQLAMFLDRLAAAACTGMSFLLRDGFERSTQDMTNLQSAIRALMEARGEIETPAVRTLVDGFLERFGATPEG